MDSLIFAISHIKKGEHLHEFAIDSPFFESYEGSIVSKGNGRGTVKLEVNDRFIRTEIRFKGQVELVCDRSLELFEEEITINDYLIFKFADREEEVDEHVSLIPENMQVLDLNPYLFELITLELPMKRIHPSLRDEDLEDSEAAMYFVYGTDNKVKIDNKESDKAMEEPIDPRFAALKQLKKK